MAIHPKAEAMGFLAENLIKNDMDAKTELKNQDTFILPFYVHNFELRWTDRQYEGNIVKTYKLTSETPDVRAELDELIKNGDLKKVHKVGSTNSNLYLIGWNYLDKENKAIKFPVFGRYTPKVYHTIEKANEIAEELQMQGYACRII